MTKIINSKGDFLIIYKKKIIFHSTEMLEFRFEYLVKKKVFVDEIYREYRKHFSNPFFIKEIEKRENYDLWIAYYALIKLHSLNL